MPTKELGYRIDNFSLGVHQEVDYSILKPGACLDMQNFDISDGTLKVSNSNSTEIPTPLPNASTPVALMTYYQNNTGYLLVVGGGHVYKWTGSAWTDLGGGLTTTATTYDFVNDNVNSADVLIFTNGVDNVKIYEGGASFRDLKNRMVINKAPTAAISYKNSSGTVVSGIPTVPYYMDGNGIFHQTLGTITTVAPHGKALAMHYERLWICDDNNLYASTSDVDGFDVEDYTTPTDETEVNMHGFEMFLYTMDGSKVVAMDTVFDDLIIWKEKSIHKLFGADPSTYQKINFAAKGGISDKSVAIHEAGAFFIDLNGIYFYDGTNINLMSTPITKTWKTLNQSCLKSAVGHIRENKYIVAVPEGTSTTNNLLIIYDISTRSFSFKRQFTLQSIVSLGTKSLFVKSGMAGIFVYDNGSDSNMYSYWKNGLSDWALPNAAKEISSLYFTAFGTGTINFVITTEKGAKTKSISVTSQEKVYNLNFNHRGKLVSVEINSLGGGFTLKNLTIVYEPDYD